MIFTYEAPFSKVKSPFSRGFPMVFPWFSYGFRPRPRCARGTTPIALQRRETGAVAGRFLGLAALAVKLHLERRGSHGGWGSFYSHWFSGVISPQLGFFFVPPCTATLR